MSFCISDISGYILPSLIIGAHFCFYCCRYILMAEPDHIFVRPLPNLSHGGMPAGYPFFYIKPEQNEKIIRKFYPEENGPVTNVDPIGNSPVIIRKVTFFLPNSSLLVLSCVYLGFLYCHVLLLLPVVLVTELVIVFVVVPVGIKLIMLN